MALNVVQTNIVSEIQTISSELLSIKGRMTSLVGMYANEGISALTDADYASYPPFAHIIAAELQAAGAALVAINTALGDWTPTSNVAKLLKIVTAVPK
jgi:hypothetical protein